MNVLLKLLEQEAREGRIKIRETQAAECVTFLAELLELPVTHALSLKINEVRLSEWLNRQNLDVGRIEKQAQELRWPHS